MSTIDDAAQLIAMTVGDDMLTHEAAQALADAGLLAPDLPDIDKCCFPDGSMELSTIDGYVCLEPDGLIIVAHDDRDEYETEPEPEYGILKIRDTTQAHHLALALLAAAKKAEEQ